MEAIQLFLFEHYSSKGKEKCPPGTGHEGPEGSRVTDLLFL
jgi:hypothetical protein